MNVYLFMEKERPIVRNHGLPELVMYSKLQETQKMVQKMDQIMKRSLSCFNENGNLKPGCDNEIDSEMDTMAIVLRSTVQKFVDTVILECDTFAKNIKFSNHELMPYVSAFINAIRDGKKNPKVGDLNEFLSTCGVDIDADAAKLVVSRLIGKPIEVLESLGTYKLALICGGVVESPDVKKEETVQLKISLVESYDSQTGDMFATGLKGSTIDQLVSLGSADRTIYDSGSVLVNSSTASSGVSAEEAVRIILTGSGVDINTESARLIVASFAKKDIGVLIAEGRAVISVSMTHAAE
ncbi:unnamed protein product [Caenorhabditis nigoni]